MKMMKKSLMVVGVALAISSCSKEGDVPVTESIDSPMEVVAKEPAPGDYNVLRFIDAGIDVTPMFTGYSFEFESDGGFIATTPEGVFVGSWDMNYSETEIDLSIGGTPALNHLSGDDWAVDRITNKGIKLSAPGANGVVFRADDGY